MHHTAFPAQFAILASHPLSHRKKEALFSIGSPTGLSSTEAAVSKGLDQRCEAADPPIASHICSTALLLVFSAGLHHLLLCSTTCIIPSIPVMNAPVHCMPVTVSGFLGGKLQTSPFLERFSRVAFLETTGHNPSSLLLSGCSLTLPSQRHRILVPCALSVFTSCSASSSN